MTNSSEITALENLLSDIKILSGSLSILDRASENMDQVSRDTALDAINFRVREISKNPMALSLNVSATNSTSATSATATNPNSATSATSATTIPVLQIEVVLAELSNSMPNLKHLHNQLDAQLETLRKMVLSKILNLSVE